MPHFYTGKKSTCSIPPSNGRLPLWADRFICFKLLLAAWLIKSLKFSLIESDWAYGLYCMHDRAAYKRWSPCLPPQNFRDFFGPNFFGSIEFEFLHFGIQWIRKSSDLDSTKSCGVSSHAGQICLILLPPLPSSWRLPLLDFSPIFFISSILLTPGIPSFKGLHFMHWLLSPFINSLFSHERPQITSFAEQLFQLLSGKNHLFRALNGSPHLLANC